MAQKPELSGMLRPVILAAAMTILGTTALLGDGQSASMAVTTVGGLAFASVRALITAPVFSYILIPGTARVDAVV